MVEEVVVAAYGVDVVIEAAETDLADLVAALPPGFSPAFRPAGAAARRYEVRRCVGADLDVRVDGRLLAGPEARPEILRRLHVDLERFTAEHSPSHVFVHSGVVAFEGRAIVLPGASGAGKTSAVVALVKAGATYLSDEFAVFDDAGAVHPYARPLNVRSAGRREPKVVDPTTLGDVATEPMPLGCIVLTRYDRAASWRPAPVAPGQAVLRVLEHTIPARVDPDRVLRVLGRVCESVPVVESPRGTAATFAAALLKLPPWRA